MIDFESRLSLKISNYTPLKRFMSQMNPKKVNTKLHSQINYHKLLVTPFKIKVFTFKENPIAPPPVYAPVYNLTC